MTTMTTLFMKKERMCICGTVRNVGKYIDVALRNMHTIGKNCLDYHIILYYDDSSDNTLEKLMKEKEKEGGSRLTLLQNSEKMSPLRTVRIAKGRNAILDEMRKNFHHFSMFIMMDCDDKANFRVNLSLLERCIRAKNKWDSVSFKHPDHYYDCWALSVRPFVLSCHGFKNWSQGAEYIKRLMSRAKPGTFIPVLSAFNGFAMYKMSTFLPEGHYNGRYDPKLFHPTVSAYHRHLARSRFNPGPEDCEHRSFHVKASQRGARIVICPEQVFVV